MKLIPEMLFIAICAAAAVCIIKSMAREWKQSIQPKDIIVVHSYFNIRNAAMCINCETVFSRQHHKQCPACASESAYIVGLALKTNEVRPHLKMKGVTLQ